MIEPERIVCRLNNQPLGVQAAAQHFEKSLRRNFQDQFEGLYPNFIKGPVPSNQLPANPKRVGEPLGYFMRSNHERDPVYARSLIEVNVNDSGMLYLHTQLDIIRNQKSYPALNESPASHIYSHDINFNIDPNTCAITYHSSNND